MSEPGRHVQHASLLTSESETAQRTAGINQPGAAFIGAGLDRQGESADGFFDGRGIRDPLGIEQRGNPGDVRGGHRRALEGTQLKEIEPRTEALPERGHFLCG